MEEKMRPLDVSQETLMKLQEMKEGLLHSLDAITRGMNIVNHIHPCKWYEKKSEKELENFFSNLHYIKVRIDDFKFTPNGVFYEERRVYCVSEFDRCYQKWHVEIVGCLRWETWNSDALGVHLEDILLYCKKLEELI